jgi:hypothetical protein
VGADGLRLNPVWGGLLLYGMLAAGYIAATPAFEAPDEASHYLYIVNLLEDGALPVLEDRETVFASGSVQRHHPPLYYAIGALLIAGVERSSDEALRLNPFASQGQVEPVNNFVHLHMPQRPAAVWVLRVYSALLSACTLLVIYACARRVTGDRAVALGAMLLVMAIPSFLHVGTSINNDVLVTLLFSLGIWLCLYAADSRRLSTMVVLGGGLLLGAIALTKINGLSLLVVMYGWVGLGVLRTWFRPAHAIRFFAGTALIAFVCAGWWYARNVMLYGDPLAAEATLRIWSRGEPTLPSFSEMVGVWESFWMLLGYFSVRGPEWLYALYLPLITLTGAVGCTIAVIRRPAGRAKLLLLLGVGGLVLVLLVAATSRINVSQGRILFPGMAAYAVLLVTGWAALLGTRLARALVLPLLAVCMSTPLVLLPQRYPTARVLDDPPADMRGIDVHVGGLSVIGYRIDTPHVQPGEVLRFTLFVRGRAEADLFLAVAVLDPMMGDVLGQLDTYPGMAPVSQLDPALLYALPAALVVERAGRGGMVDLILAWRQPADPITLSPYVPAFDSQGASIETVRLAEAFRIGLR